MDHGIGFRGPLEGDFEPHLLVIFLDIERSLCEGVAVADDFPDVILDSVGVLECLLSPFSAYDNLQSLIEK